MMQPGWYPGPTIQVFIHRLRASLEAVDSYPRETSHKNSYVGLHHFKKLPTLATFLPVKLNLLVKMLHKVVVDWLELLLCILVVQVSNPSWSSVLLIEDITALSLMFYNSD
jgi:hypothetical protein